LHVNKTDFLEVTVKNSTNWPWKEGCTFTNLPYSEDVAQVLEDVSIPVSEYVAGDALYTFKIPLTVIPSAKVTENGKQFEAKFSFKGPKGNCFGHLMTIKFKIVKDFEEFEVYQRANELIEKQEFSQFTFEQICEALILSSMEMEATLQYLVQKKSLQSNDSKVETENKIKI